MNDLSPEKIAAAEQAARDAAAMTAAEKKAIEEVSQIAPEPTPRKDQ